MDYVTSLTERQKGHLPDYLGVVWREARPGFMHGRIEVKPHHLAPNGYLHAGTVVTLADTACGYGCFISMPEGALNFTTIELKANFLGTARDGAIAVEASLVHGGRTTQVWDAIVKDEAGSKTIALFRCTQMLIYPK